MNKADMIIDTIKSIITNRHGIRAIIKYQVVQTTLCPSKNIIEVDIKLTWAEKGGTHEQTDKMIFRADPLKYLWTI